MAGLFACLAAVVGPSSANDAVGWGVLQYDSRDTSTRNGVAVLGSTFFHRFQIACGAGHTVALRVDPTLLPGSAALPFCSLFSACTPQEGIVDAWGFNESGQATVGFEIGRAHV